MPLMARHPLNLLGLDSQCGILVMLMTNTVVLITACTGLLASKGLFVKSDTSLGAACSPQPNQMLPYAAGGTGPDDIPTYNCEQYKAYYFDFFTNYFGG